MAENVGSLVMMLMVPASASDPYISVPAPLTISIRLIVSVENNPTSAPVRSVACRAVFSRSPSTRTSRRVESSPRRRGRTPNGPPPTCVIFAAVARASPVDSGLPAATAAPVIVSTCSGMRRVSRSDRDAVTLTSVTSAPISRRIGKSTFSSADVSTTVRAASEKPGRVTMSRYVPAAGVSI